MINFLHMKMPFICIFGKRWLWGKNLTIMFLCTSMSCCNSAFTLLWCKKTDAACDAAGLSITARLWCRSDWNRENKKFDLNFRFWITTQIFPFLFKALLFIHFFFLQQQNTEAVLKIKVLFSCSCKKRKKKRERNLHKIWMTVQNEALICHVNGREGHYCWKI